MGCCRNRPGRRLGRDESLLRLECAIELHPDLELGRAVPVEGNVAPAPEAVSLESAPDETAGLGDHAGQFLGPCASAHDGESQARCIKGPDHVATQWPLG